LRYVILVVVAVIVASCGDAPSPSGDQPASAAALGPAVDCGDIASGDCEGAALAALRSVAGRGVVAEVELDRGILCPIPEFLFEKTSCPGGPLGAPAGGSWIGHAIVAFWGQERRAYLNVSRAGAAYSARLITLATRPPSER
jgi:hypothetical protein